MVAMEVELQLAVVVMITVSRSHVDLADEAQLGLTLHHFSIRAFVLC
jgi:hypothetical protein